MGNHVSGNASRDDQFSDNDAFFGIYSIIVKYEDLCFMVSSLVYSLIY